MNINWDYPNPWTLSMQVPDSAIDGLGHANNCEYLRWLEEAAWGHSRDLGLGLEDYRRLNRAMVARHTELDYLAPAFADQELIVGTWIIKNDERLSMVRQYQIVRPDDGVTLLRGNTQWVCVAFDSGKPQRMPEEFVSRYRLTAEVC
jgi:acyl-CoA thioester hydrolase